MGIMLTNTFSYDLLDQLRKITTLQTCLFRVMFHNFKRENLQMTRVFILTTLLLLFGINIGSTQNYWKPGYIIKIQGDTIYGSVGKRSKKNISEFCRFKNDATKSEKIYTAQQLSRYGFLDGKSFVSKNIDVKKANNLIFLEFLVEGKVNLYYLKDNTDHYYVEKDSKIYELKNTIERRSINNKNYLLEKSEYKKILSFLLQDAKIQDEIANCNFHIKPLIQIAKKYHDAVCTDKKCIIYEKSKKDVHLNVGIHAGLSWNSFNFGDRITTDYSLGKAIGLRLELENVIAWQENINFIFDFTFQQFTNYTLKPNGRDIYGIAYNNIRYNLTSVGSVRNKVEELDVNMELTTLKIPLSINYLFTKGKISPYAGFGVVNTIVLSQNKDFIYQKFHNEFDKSIPIYHFGLIGKLGSKFKIRNKHIVYFDLNYEHTQTNNANQFLRFKNDLFSFNLGLQF